MLHSLFWILLSIGGAWCLRMIALHIPSKTVVGATLELRCHFDLEGEPLYSVKWYRDDVEFFRFVPRDQPPAQYFPMEGVVVDRHKSQNSTLVLQDVDLSTSGVYKCEVSADRPSFQTEATKRKLVVTESGAASPVHLPSAPLLFLCCLLLTAFAAW